RWLAYMPVGEFRNVFVAPVEGGASRPVSFIANANSNTVSWSPDGTYILFDTGQRTESNQLARIDLIPRTPKFREDQFRDLFKEETPRTVTPATRPENQPTSPEPAREAPNAVPTPTASPSPSPEGRRSNMKPVQIVFEEIRRRLSLPPVGVDVGYQTISPDGKWVLMIAAAANQENLYIYSLDELAREPAVAKQLTSTAGNKAW